MRNYTEAFSQILKIVIKTMGISMRKFEDNLGVSRQTICNICSGKTKMSKTQYIVFRCYIDYFIRNNPDTTGDMIKVILYLFLDYRDYYDADTLGALYTEAQNYANNIRNFLGLSKANELFMTKANDIIGDRKIQEIISIPDNDRFNDWMKRVIEL